MRAPQFWNSSASPAVKISISIRLAWAGASTALPISPDVRGLIYLVDNVLSEVDKSVLPSFRADSFRGCSGGAALRQASRPRPAERAGRPDSGNCAGSRPEGGDAQYQRFQALRSGTGQSVGL